MARIDDHDRQTRRRQCRDRGPLVAPGRFEHNQGGGHRLEVRSQGGNPSLIVRDRPAFPAGTHGNIQLGLSNINTYKDLDL